MKVMNVKLQRLADQIRDVIAEIFAGGQMNDPRLQNLTITFVKLSADLSVANVYFLTSEGKQEETMRGLVSAKKFIKNEIASQVKMRHIPDLRFFYDESVDEGSKIENLLSQIR